MPLYNHYIYIKIKKFNRKTTCHIICITQQYKKETENREMNYSATVNDMLLSDFSTLYMEKKKFLVNTYNSKN